MVKENKDTVDGQVVEALPNTTFKVKMEGGREEVLAHLSGKMRMYRIKVVVGDKVKVELDQYGQRGRIVKRL